MTNRVQARGDYTGRTGRIHSQVFRTEGHSLRGRRLEGASTPPRAVPLQIPFHRIHE